MNLLAVRTDRELRWITPWNPRLATQCFHRRSGYRTLHNLGLLHVMGEALMIAIIVTQTGVFFEQRPT